MRKQFPNLFKTLSKQYGARKAIKIISMVREITSTHLEKSAYCLKSSFVWHETTQGHGFWANIYKGGKAK